MRRRARDIGEYVAAVALAIAILRAAIMRLLWVLPLALGTIFIACTSSATGSAVNDGGGTTVDGSSNADAYSGPCMISA